MTQPDPSPTKGLRAARCSGAWRAAPLTWGVTPRAAAASPRDLHHVVLVTMENRSFDHFPELGARGGRGAGRADLSGCRGTAPDHLCAGARLPGVRPSGPRSAAMRGAHRIQCWRL